MDTLQTVIGLMNKEEVRHFKLFANRTNAHNNRKDTLLFDHIRKTYPDEKEEVIVNHLYKTGDKNAFYRLRNRLLEDLGKSFALQYFNSNDVNYILNNISLARIFQEKGHPPVAYHYLEKAEKRANHTDNLHLLELIYTEFIKLSQETLDINPEEYINKRKTNRIKLAKIQEIDDILAAVIYRIKSTQNIASKNLKVVELLQKTVDDFSASKDINKNPQLQFKIYEAVSRILLQRNDYKSLEKYLVTTYKNFIAKKLFNKNNHETKLQLLTYLINSLFKNDKVEESLKFAEELKKAMSEFDSFLHDKYLFYYYNALIINYAKKDIKKAIDILHEAKENKVIQKLPVYMVFIYSNLAVTNFEIKNYKESLRNLVKLTIQDSYQNLDIGFRYALSIVELIIRYELGDSDFIETRIESIKKDFASIYNEPGYTRQRDFIHIISRMLMTPHLKNEKDLLNDIHRFINDPQSLLTAESGSDVINYNEWLKSKLP